MKQLPKILIILAAICIVVAIVIKLASGLRFPGGAMIWLKLGGLSLLFSIAVSLLPERK